MYVHERLCVCVSHICTCANLYAELTMLLPEEQAPLTSKPVGPGSYGHISSWLPQGTARYGILVYLLQSQTHSSPKPKPAPRKMTPSFPVPQLHPVHALPSPDLDTLRAKHACEINSEFEQASVTKVKRGSNNSIEDLWRSVAICSFRTTARTEGGASALICGRRIWVSARVGSYHIHLCRILNFLV